MKKEFDIKKYKGIIAQVIFAVAVLALWQIIATEHPSMAFPTLTDIFKTLFADFGDSQRVILEYLGNSLVAILEGLGIGILFAFIFSALSVISETFAAIYNLIVSVFDLLPGVALLPILMITIGANSTSILILVVHSVLWPMSRSIIDGFKSTPKLYVEAGRNIGLNRASLITGVYIPATFASVLSGIKVGWARAWRGLISAEMIFGAAGSQGIGVFIHKSRTLWIDYKSVYAALFLIIVVGVIVEYGIFYQIEKHTVRKWGMVR